MTAIHPVAAAVEPLRADAKKRAEQEAVRIVTDTRLRIEEAGFDLNVAFPRPDSARHGRNEYLRLKAEHDAARRLVRPEQPSRSSRAPFFVRWDIEAADSFIRQSVEAADEAYSSFVAKLVHKVGDCLSAEIGGNHVWANSILTVEKAGGVVEHWSTKTIINRSKLGLLFLQWPSRRVKSRGRW